MKKSVLNLIGLVTVTAVLSACGKSEWHEVKNPNTGDAKAEAAHGDLTPTTVQPNQTAYVATDRLRGRETPEQNPADSSTLLERGDQVQVTDAHPVGQDQLVRIAVPVDDDEEVVDMPMPKTPAASSATPTPTPEPKLSLSKKSLKEPPVYEKKIEVKKAAPHKAEPKKTEPKKTEPKKIEPKKVEKKAEVKTAEKKVVTKKKTKKVYVPLRYLQSKPVEISKEQADANAFVMIQNVATGKLRVYQTAKVSGEPNLLVFETDMFMGENEPQKTRRTALGSYKIEKWIKFYQDNQGLAPSWYDSQAESVPLPGSEIEDWMQHYLLPTKADGQPSGYVRGGFGWYTAKIGPNAHAQWTHGTLGWGGDGDRFIKNVSNFKLREFFADPRVFGCTRVENQAIAYMQEILPVGTRVIKVYAKESIADAALERYKDIAPVQTFDWILSKDDVRVENPRSSWKTRQLPRELSMEQILEEGTYAMDAHPDAVPFEKIIGERGQSKMVAMDANLYDIPKASFQGEFLVDEGRFVNYKHPRELRKGGYSDQLLPKVVVKK